jgi:hypothetical protein
MDVVDAGANTLLTIESPRETHLSFADGSPAQGAIPPLLARGSYFIGSPTPKPPFLVNSTFPAVCTHLLIPSVMYTLSQRYVHTFPAVCTPFLSPALCAPDPKDCKVTECNLQIYMHNTSVYLD